MREGDPQRIWCVVLMRKPPEGMSPEIKEARRSGIGGSDARIIMSGDQDAIEALWREKSGLSDGPDFSDVLLIQMGIVLEPLNLFWFEKRTGYKVKSEQKRAVFPGWERAMCTLDGEVFCPETDAMLGLFEAKFMLPYYWTLEGAVTKYWPQLQHNMMVCGADRIWISVITGGAGFSYVEIEADPFYQIQMLRAEQDFWECVETGRIPGCPVIEVPIVIPDRVIDMSGSNSWAEQAGIILETKPYLDRHAKASKEIKTLMPADAKEARGHGIKITRSKTGTLTVKVDKEG